MPSKELFEERASQATDQDGQFWSLLAKAWPKRQKDPQRVLRLCRVIRGLIGDDPLVVETMALVQTPEPLLVAVASSDKPGVCPRTGKVVPKQERLNAHQVCQQLGVKRVPRKHMVLHGYELKQIVDHCGTRQEVWVSKPVITRGIHCECLTKR